MATEEQMLKALQEIMLVIEVVPELGNSYTHREALDCDEALSEIYGICEDLGRLTED